MTRQRQRAQARGLVWIGRLAFVACALSGVLLALAGGTIGLAAFLVGQGLGPAAANVLAGFIIVIGGLIVGLVIATPLIVAGELILIFLEQRAIARRHLRVARAIRQALRRAAPDDARPRQRRVI